MIDASTSPGAPTALQYFCSTCTDNPDTTQSGTKRIRDLGTSGLDSVSERLLEERATNCPAGTVTPGLELTVTTFANNTGRIVKGAFENC